MWTTGGSSTAVSGEKAAEVIRIAWRLRREQFDVGFNFHRDWRFNIILFLAGCKRRIGFASGRKSILLTEAVRIAGVKHHVFHYCDLLKKIGIFCLDFKLEFALGADALAAAADKFLRPENLEHYVVIAPGGAANVKEEMESRRWPARALRRPGRHAAPGRPPGGPAGQRRRCRDRRPHQGGVSRGRGLERKNHPGRRPRRC